MASFKSLNASPGMVPLSAVDGQRRHRIYGEEVREVLKGLAMLLTSYARAEEDVSEAEMAFRPFFRMLYHQAGRPNYPDPLTWNVLVEHLKWYHLLAGGPGAEKMVPLVVEAVA